MILFSVVTTPIIILFVLTSPELHCYNASEETKKDYIQYLYDGLKPIDKLRIDSGEARIIDSPDVPIDFIGDKAYEFCIEQKPNVPETVVIQFENLDGE